MKTLISYVKESLLDIDDVENDVAKKIDVHAIKEIIKDFTQYKCKHAKCSRYDIGFIFDKKYDHKKWNTIVAEFENDLKEFGITFEKDSGNTGSSLLYYDDFTFYVDGIEMAVEFNYHYTLDINGGERLDEPKMKPKYGILRFYAYGSAE